MMKTKKERKDYALSETTVLKAPKEELISMIEARSSLEAMQVHFRMSGETLHKLADHYGLVLPSRAKAEAIKLTPVRKKQLRAALDLRPKTYSELRKLMGGIAESTIQRWMRDCGWTMAFDEMKAERKAFETLVIQRLNAGETSTSVASSLGVTKGVIAGIRGRAIAAGMVIRVSESSRQERAVNARMAGGKFNAPKGKPKPKPLKVVKKDKTEPRGPTEPTRVVLKRDFAHPIPFEEVRNGRCRYPIGDRPPYLFCGEPVMPTSSYCEACSLCCFEPEEFKRRKNKQIGYRSAPRLAAQKAA